jgi:hypothetical protein
VQFVKLLNSHLLALIYVVYIYFSNPSNSALYGYLLTWLPALVLLCDLL